MAEMKHPTLRGEIVHSDVNMAAFAFNEPQRVEILAPVSPDAEKSDALIGQPRANATVSGTVRQARSIGPKSRSKAARRFALQIVGSEEYRQSIWTRLREGTLSPAVETALLAYAYGKPVARQEIDAQQSLTINVTRPW